MLFSWMWHHVALLQTEVSEECVTSIFREEEITHVMKVLRQLLTEATRSFKTLVYNKPTGATSQKTAFLLVITTKNLKYYKYDNYFKK
jgi:hypothetical protein